MSKKSKLGFTSTSIRNLTETELDSAAGGVLTRDRRCGSIYNDECPALTDYGCEFSENGSCGATCDVSCAATCAASCAATCAASCAATCAATCKNTCNANCNSARICPTDRCNPSRLC